jgi:3-oxoacyl-[acyl-carrier-protein] synthase II
MNRDAQMAVVAAHFAMEDAEISSDKTYPAEDIALYGATGVAGMSIEEITRIIRHAACEDGTLNLESFGRIALRRVRPVLSFRILANMPICFVSIFQNIKGPNAVYTPWEGHGAQAIIAGIQAIKRDLVQCALVGGCDCRTRELSFINLQQLGIFESWKKSGKGSVPGEGSVFLVLEDEEAARRREKKAYAKISDYKLNSVTSSSKLKETLLSTISELEINGKAKVIAASDGDVTIAESEKWALEHLGLDSQKLLKPKSNIGNLFAAAAAVQVGLAAKLTSRDETKQQIIANCFGYGSEYASFMLEAV